MNYFEIPALSNSSLSTFSYDPSYYHKVYITKEIQDKRESASLTLGSLVHCLLLEPEEVQNRYVISKLNPEDKPSGMMLDFVNALLKAEIQDELAIDVAYSKAGYKISKDKVLENFNKPAVQTYYQEQLAAKGKTLVMQNEFDQAVQAANVARDNPQWVTILGTHEWTVHYELEILMTFRGVLCKSKLDELRIRKVGDTLFVKYFDYKTDSQKPVHKYLETFEFWKTYRQMAFYYEAIHSYLAENYPHIKTTIVSMYLVPIDVVRMKSLIYHVDKSYLQKGWNEITHDIDALKWHIEHDKWEFPKHIYDNLELAGGLSLTCTDYEELSATSV